MAMVCPQCNGLFEQRLQCPTCGIRLLYQAAPSRAARGAPGEGAQWQQTPWGRILIGLLLSQGLYYGLRHLCTAGLLATRDDASRTAWHSLTGLVLLQALQGVSLLLGGMLAGAGKRQGVIFGAVVGVWNGVISILVMSAAGYQLTAVAFYGQPVLHTAFGALGGFVGSLVWRPLPTLAPLGPRRSGPLLKTSKKTSLLDGPVAWGRVIAGSAVAAGGTIWAKLILEMVLESAEGVLNIDSHMQAQLVTMEITALATLAGSALAGATTANSLKQGLFVGLGTSAVIVGLLLAANQMAIHPIIFMASNAVALSMAGGWFGGQLFPPVAPARPKNLGPASL
jgi:hypothetical protein